MIQIKDNANRKKKLAKIAEGHSERNIDKIYIRLKKVKEYTNQPQAAIDFLSDCFGEKDPAIKTNIGNLLKSAVSEFNDIIDNYNRKGYGDSKKMLSPCNKEETFQKALLYIFGYNSYDSWGAYQLAEELNFNTCPYCNRNFTFTVGTDKIKGTRPEFDHFYDKDRYPYLSLCFYNLIPSCHICNSNLKSTKQFKVGDNIHPYLEGFGNEIKFSLEINYKKSLNVTGTVRNQNAKDLVQNKTNFKADFFTGNQGSFEIVFKKSTLKKDEDLIKRAEKNIEVFRLEDLYNKHKDVASEMIQKAVVYINNTYINDLVTDFPTLFKSEDDARRMVLGNYTDEDDLEKRPLSKLTKDIAEELGLL